MARAERPVSESYRPKCCSVSQSVSYSIEAGTVGLEDEDDRAPIFSLSKSSMDVVMATGPPHKRDPAWTRMDLRRSFSSTTQSEQNLVKLQQLYPHMQQHISATDNLQLFLTTQNMDVHSPPLHSGRWIADMQRWSGCSGNTHSRSSTPETVVWKVGTSRPSSLTQDTPSLAAPHSPISKPASPPTTPSPFISPLHTPTLSPVDLLASASPLMLSTNQQEDLLMSSPAPSPLPSSPKVHTSSPLPCNSCDLQLRNTENEGFLENNLLSFQFPSPVLSSVNLAEAGGSGPRCHSADLIEELLLREDMQLTEEGGVGSPVHMFSYLAPTSPAEGHESGREASVCNLELPWQPDQSCLAGRGWRSHLVSSLSESRLGDSCRCNLNPREITAKVFREEGTMTLQIQTVDAAVQTVSPIGSWWDLRRNISTSNMGSHSILGSPPGSRLNLKSSVGSNSNLVSPSSSMFPVSSGEEERQGDDPAWDVSSASSHDLDRRRPCLKIQVEEKDELGRRSSMKQVQWDEDGMTWDIHGTSVDTEVLNMAIQKHLELDNSARPQRRTSKKKKAPKPPLISNVVKAITPELNPPVMIITSTCMAEGQNEGTTEAGDRREVEEVEDTKEEAVEVIRRISRAEGQNTKEEDESCEDESTSHTRSLSHGCGRSRKKSVIRSLRRPGWCGSSRKEDG